jgi:hypothetical protein
MKYITGNRAKTLRTDNGTEFVNSDLKTVLRKLGVKHEKTIPYTPEQNGAVERDNRTLVEIGRTLLHATSLPEGLWSEMINTAVYLHNRIPNRKDKISPYEWMTGKKPEIDHLRIIASRTFVSIPKSQRTKWEKTSWMGILVGYGNSRKFYRIYKKSMYAKMSKYLRRKTSAEEWLTYASSQMTKQKKEADSRTPKTKEQLVEEEDKRRKNPMKKRNHRQMKRQLNKKSGLKEDTGTDHR